MSSNKELLIRWVVNDIRDLGNTFLEIELLEWCSNIQFSSFLDSLSKNRLPVLFFMSFWALFKTQLDSAESTQLLMSCQDDRVSKSEQPETHQTQ